MINTQAFGRLLSILSIGALGAFATGCGDGSLPMATVAGKVTINDEPVTSGIIVFFDPATGDGASAPLSETGEFKVTAEMRTGNYAVAFQPPPLPPPLEMGPGRVPRPRLEDVPIELQSTETSGVTVDVKEGDNALDINFSVKDPG